ncbi:hypothetical protein LEP1GSC079_3339 [Leptospira interrogans str. FPW1039]|uniref:Uncharacterized protein n=1 Tax=Leptospira interrogans str. FPW1039 TaxID=1193040 RepID=A0A0F6IHE4_LEPIR|nr:hypothetical protein LEP1GSC045_1917 [Leptospira interrogans serovar Pomona str. Kennewicki LC82-25]EKN95761.1 hypothetical protein LEP1GSC014_1760 [Leptospira interrogans serovar Pomona str. Pomona]EKR34022.1 hypothetical protein LEP1GSC096_0249 [Leptospira interrogans serovar Hebdomadis str. R499]EKR82620.1 hypothetical protein LEP1GSC099_2752 [Leptospira interrogans str. UI 08452]EMF32470.1 hypothetical protein LEP1GSC201_0407 [Leptospira interrogans serovar Pomona str. Fox 32256]EMI6732
MSFLFAKIFLRQIRIKIIGVYTLENSFSFSQAELHIIIEIHPYSKLYN